MALLWMDGFDSYAGNGDPLIAGYSGNGAVSTTGGRFGKGCIQGGNSQFTYALASAVTDVWFGGAAQISSGSTGVILYRFNSSIGIEITIGINTDGSIYAQRGDFVTSLGSSAAGFFTPFTGTWHWVETHIVFSGTVGVVEIWVDGVRALNLTGQNTKQNSGATGLISATYGSLSSSVTWNWDDIYITDTTGSAPLNGRLGDSRIDTVVPSSDASPNNGTISTGATHWGVVDELQYNTTDYTDITATTGQEERFGVTGVSGTVGTVYGVKVLAWNEKTDAGAASAKLEVVSGSSVGLGASFNPTTTWAQNSAIFPTDPSTSAAWTAAEIAAMKIGVVIP